VTEIPGTLTTTSPFGGQDRALAAKARAAAAAFWVRAFFCVAEHAPRGILAARGALCRGAFRSSASVRRGTRANARRLLGPTATAREVDRLARRILSSFYLACCDIGRSFSATREQLFGRVETAQGDEHYQAARAARKGLIVVTAHMGSFEVGMAALRERERAKIHVVFRRDPFERFERLRSGLRKRLGVEEAPVDDGWTVWMRLRDALLADEVVVLQGDRVMPGQKGEPVPFLGGRMLLPAGPVKMALATGAPIVPIFSVRMSNGNVRLFVEPAIWVERVEPAAPGGPHPALLQWAAVLERYVRAYPDQWLMLGPALCDDAEMPR
jgi:KDO2-lipid IV(A) lauroyltransferase